ncbi:MAG: hypothetical protein U1C55_03630 [Smithellaceae bacterium]|nr:hypothetical protein [Smithellaceae bacterium]
MDSANAERNDMKLLHTSDWHLGRALYSHNRYEECEAFLNRLTILIHCIAIRDREEN